MIAHLELIVRKRIQQAQAKDFVKKVELIAMEFGVYEEKDKKRPDPRPRVYETKTLRIAYSQSISSGGHSELFSIVNRTNNKTVFEGECYSGLGKAQSINAYIPGEWENELEQIYNQAEQNRTIRFLDEKKKEKKDYEKSLRERFGIVER